MRDSFLDISIKYAFPTIFDGAMIYRDNSSNINKQNSNDYPPKTRSNDFGWPYLKILIEHIFQ